MMPAVTAVKYRSVIRFLVLRGNNADHIMPELQLAYGDSSPSCTTTYDWIKLFEKGCVSVQDGKSTGRPVEIGDSHDEKLTQIICEEKRITKGECPCALSC